MESIFNIINWGKDNIGTIIQLYLALVGLASVIVKITPTSKDNEVLSKVVEFLAKYVSLNKKIQS